MTFYCGFNIYFPERIMIWNTYLWVYSHLLSFLWSICSNFFPVKKLSCLYVSYWFIGGPYKLWNWFLSLAMLLLIYSHTLQFAFILSYWWFWWAELLISVKSTSPIFTFVVSAFSLFTTELCIWCEDRTYINFFPNESSVVLISFMEQAIWNLCMPNLR